MRAGDFALSLAQAQEDMRRWPEGDSGWRFRLLAAEDLISLGRTKEASVLLEKAGIPSNADLRARWTADRGRLLRRSEPAKARKLFEEALEGALNARDVELVCILRLRLGEIAGSFSKTEAYYRAALADAERRRDPYLIAWARVRLGYNRASASRFDEAIPFLQEALQTAQQCGAREFVAAATGNLGWCYWRLGDLDKAMDAFVQAEALTERLGLRDSQHRWLGAIGNIYLARGDFDRAESFEQRAATLAGEVGNDEWQAMARHNLAQIAVEKGDLPTARSYSVKELAIRIGGDSSLLASSELTAAEIEQLSGKYALAERDLRAVIRQAPQANAPDVLWEAYANLASLYSERGNRKQAAAQYRNAIDTIDREWNNLRTDESKTTFLTLHLVGVFQDYVGFLIKTGRMEAALELAESARARILSLRLERLRAVPPTFDLAALQRAAQASHTVILSYWLEPRRSSVWVIGSGRLARFDLPPGKEIDGLVRKYTETITQGRDPLARNDAGASALYQAVLGPVAKLIPAGSNVIVVPDGELHQLNFETLVVPRPQPHYWIEDVAVATAPSLRVLTGDAHRPVRPPKLLILGDPVLSGPEFGSLPNVKNEIAAVEACFRAANVVAFTGARAVPGEYAKASPANFTHIHFATHATANLESPLNSAIILSHQGETYKLYARDVADVPLQADLVTLSACKSAGAKAYSGEGLMGFAWAFLQAGAQNVIATLWDEDDAVSAGLMRVLYKEIAAGQTPARALRASKLTLMRSAGPYRLPYYWGPLQVFTREIAIPSKTAPT
jgi:CHAT domain-containing protein